MITSQPYVASGMLQIQTMVMVTGPDDSHGALELRSVATSTIELHCAADRDADLKDIGYMTGRWMRSKKYSTRDAILQRCHF